MVCLNRKGLSSALVVILLAAAGILIATIAIGFLKGAALEVNKTAAEQLGLAIAALET